MSSTETESLAKQIGRLIGLSDEPTNGDPVEQFDDLAARYERGLAAGHWPSLTLAVELYGSQGLPLPDWATKAVAQLVEDALDHRLLRLDAGPMSKPRDALAMRRLDFERWHQVERLRGIFDYLDQPEELPPIGQRTEEQRKEAELRKKHAALIGTKVEGGDGKLHLAFKLKGDAAKAAVQEMRNAGFYEPEDNRAGKARAGKPAKVGGKLRKAPTGDTADSTRTGWEKVRDAIKAGEADIYFAAAGRPIWEWPKRQSGDAV